MAQEIADSKLIDTWSSDGLKVKPDISKIIEGWQLGEQPPHEYMNWLQNTFGSKLNHILKNGVASWNNKTEYLAGSSVQHNGNVWLCKTTNTNSAPTDANANWKRIITVESLADLSDDYVATTGNQTIAGVKTFSSTIAGSISGNSATATKLATARTIGGVSFDGSANINLPGVNTAGNQDTTGNAATVTNGVYTTGNQTIAGVKTFQSNIILDNGTSDGPDFTFRDTTNLSSFSIDLYNEQLRIYSSYRNAPIAMPFQVFLSNRIALMYGYETLVSFAQNLQPNGYKIISNTAGGEKVVLQWGSMAEGNVTQTVTFPAAFPNACAIFIPVLIGAGAKYASLESSPTKTQATITKSIDYSWRWFAIGY